MLTLKGTEVSVSYVQCFLCLVSSSINVSIFHITWLDTFWTDLVSLQKKRDKGPTWPEIVSETVIFVLVLQWRSNFDPKTFTDYSPPASQLFSIYITHALPGAPKKLCTSASLSISHALCALWWNIIYI